VSKLTPLDYEKVVKALTNIGYVVNNQKGSHIVMRLSEKEKYVSLFCCFENALSWLIILQEFKRLTRVIYLF